MSSDPRLPDEPCRAGPGFAGPDPGDPAAPADRPFTPWPGQDENGVDLTLIRENLRLTPEQRIRRGDLTRRQALRLMELAHAGRNAAVRSVR
ncbi:MAG: hypothetical protein H6811_08870 [Phycisphaeraceae bacterium]|nr:hypothetical protein [Phycisphaeraceae bacterium]